MPLVAVHHADQVPDFDLSSGTQAYDAGLVTKERISEVLDDMRAQMGDLGDSIVAQQAVAAARDELEAAGGT